MWKHEHVRREEEKGGEGAGNGGGGNAITPEVQALIDKAVGDAVTGLKSKNGELLGKLKDQSETLKRFEGIDPDAVNNILKRFADDDEAGLIKAGKLDEVLDKRTARIKAASDKETANERKAREAAEAKVSKFTQRVLENHIRAEASASGIHKHAIDDALLRARAVFSVDDEGNAQAGEDLFGKDGKPLTLKEWFSEMKENAPHWWPAANGGGASNGGGSHNAQPGNWNGNEAERVAAIRKKFPNLPS